MFAARAALLTGPSAAVDLSGFVTRDTASGKLMLDGSRFRFAGTNYSGMALTESANNYGGTNVTATFSGRTTGTTSYTLHLATHSEINDMLGEAELMDCLMVRTFAAMTIGHPLSVQPTLGVFSATNLEPLDYALQQCASRGIKLMLPLTDNYEYFMGGKFDYCRMNGVTPDSVASQFFTNTTIRNSFKAHISFVLNHVNTYTGVAYRLDPTIFAWEIGNELTVYPTAWPYQSWTDDIATYIKTTLGAQQLVADGKLSVRDSGSTNAIDFTSLELASVDIIGMHPYDEFREPKEVVSQAAIAKAYGKAFVLGEHTWTDKKAGGATNGYTLPEMTTQYEASNDIDGSMFWQLLPTATSWGDGFTMHRPGDTADMTARGTQLVNHADVMNANQYPTIQLLATTSSGQSSRQRSVTFDGTYWIPQPDDLILMIAADTATASFTGTNTGWTNPLGGTTSITSTANAVGVCYRRVTYAEATAGTLAYSSGSLWVSNATAGNTVGIVLRGVDPTTAIDVRSTTFSSTAVTPHVYPGLTPTIDNGYVVHCVSSNGTETYTLPDGLGQAHTNGTNQRTRVDVRNMRTLAGVAVPNTNITPSGSNQYCAFSLVFKPAAAVNTAGPTTPARNQVVAIGDSITDYGSGFDYQPYLGGQYLNLLHVHTMQRMRFGGVYATGGITLTEMRDVHLPQVLALSPAPGACVVFCGTNDTGNVDLTFDLAYSSMVLKQIVGALLAAGIAPIVVATPPHDLTSLQDNVEVWNTWVRQYAAANGFTLIDAYTALADPDRTYKTGYSSDGVHPLPIGYDAIVAQAIADGVPNIFPTNDPTLLTARTTGDLTNLLNDGTTNLGMFTTDTNSDGVSDGFTTTGTGSFSRVTPVSGDNLVGSWQRLRHSTTGQTLVLSRAITSGWAVGDKLALGARVRTANITSSGIAWSLTVDAAVPGGFTYPDGSTGTAPRHGAVSWLSDVGVIANGLLYVEFTVPTGTTTLTLKATLNSRSSNTPDPILDIGELTVRKL